MTIFVYNTSSELPSSIKFSLVDSMSVDFGLDILRVDSEKYYFIPHCNSVLVNGFGIAAFYDDENDFNKFVRALDEMGVSYS